MPALMYGEILSGLVVDQLGSSSGRSTWVRNALTAVSLLVAVAGFLFYAPWIYAFGEDRQHTPTHTGSR